MKTHVAGYRAAGVGIAAYLIAVTAASSTFAQGSLAGLTQWEEGRSMRAGSNVWIENDKYNGENNFDRPDRIEAGETYVMADLEGPGIITHIWLTFLQEPHFWVQDGACDPQEMLIRIYWDGREKPDVEAPVGDFFANCCSSRRRKRKAGSSTPLRSRRKSPCGYCWS